MDFILDYKLIKIERYVYTYELVVIGCFGYSCG